MKRFKSLSALFLALILAFSLSVPAFAATGNNTITSIKYNSLTLGGCPVPSGAGIPHQHKACVCYEQVGENDHKI